MRAAGSGLRLAVGTLSVVRVGDVGTITAPVARAAMTLAPIAVLPLALVVAGISLAGEAASLPGLVTAVLVVAALAVGSRGMHLDGLADTVDGLGAGWERERALTVMRAGDVGPMGAAALTLVLVAQIAAIAAVLATWRGWLLIAVSVCVSRAACAVLARRGVPAARGDGLGAAVAGSVPTVTVVLVGLACGAATALCTWTSGRGWWHGIFAFVITGVVLLALVRTAVRVFGGVTGDVMGAGIELALTSLLVSLSAGG